MQDYLPAILGGGLIGLAAVILMLFNGKIAGISGIAWQATQLNSAKAWQWLFIIGLITGAYIAHNLFSIEIPQTVTRPIWLVIAAGLFVGYGVKRGSGCTSGHGICGIGRISKRSMIATLTFMVSGVITVTILYALEVL